MSFVQWLNASGYSAITLAEILGVSRQTIYHWRNGTRLPRTEHLIKLDRLSQGLVGLHSFKITSNHKR